MKLYCAICIVCPYRDMVKIDCSLLKEIKIHNQQQRNMRLTSSNKKVTKSGTDTKEIHKSMEGTVIFFVQFIFSFNSKMVPVKPQFKTSS